MKFKYMNDINSHIPVYTPQFKSLGSVRSLFLYFFIFSSSLCLPWARLPSITVHYLGESRADC